jgi:hypothetical protein
MECKHSYCASRPLVSSRCFRQMTPGLGPPRPAQHDPHLSTRSHRRLPRFVLAAAHPNGVAKRFPDWTAVGFRANCRADWLSRLRKRTVIAAVSRTLEAVSPLPAKKCLHFLVPRIACPSRPFLAHLRHAGSDALLIGGLSPPGLQLASAAPCFATSTNFMHHLRRS